jgi:hypothetical protein
VVEIVLEMGRFGIELKECRRYGAINARSGGNLGPG